MIWLQSDKVFFNNGSVEAPNLINNLFQQANEIIMIIGILNASGLGKAFEEEVFNRWRQLEIGWIKVNFDGTCSNRGNFVVARGVLHD